MPVILNTKALASLGYTEWFIQGVKLAGKALGDSPFAGRYTTAARLEAWVFSHPDFVAAHYVKAEQSRRLRGRPAGAACRSDAPS
jgi:hypothetical protein